MTDICPEKELKMEYTYEEYVFASELVGGVHIPTLYIIRNEEGRVVDRFLNVENAEKLGYMPLEELEKKFSQ